MQTTTPVTQLTERQRKAFYCGTPALDEYFRQFAKGNHVKNIGKTFALLTHDSAVMGYYTLSMGNVDFFALPADFLVGLPKYPVPIARIARLAVDVKSQRQGWGKFLLVDALRRIQEAALHIAAYGVVVDAKDEKAKSFYLHFGFKTFPDNNLCLILPTSSIACLMH